MMSNLHKNLEGDKSIYEGTDTMWKLNTRDKKITLTKLLINHAKFTPKETEIGAYH